MQIENHFLFSDNESQVDFLETAGKEGTSTLQSMMTHHTDQAIGSRSKYLIIK